MTRGPTELIKQEVILKALKKFKQPYRHELSSEMIVWIWVWHCWLTCHLIHISWREEVTEPILTQDSYVSTFAAFCRP